MAYLDSNPAPIPAASTTNQRSEAPALSFRKASSASDQNKSSGGSVDRIRAENAAPGASRAHSPAHSPTLRPPSIVPMAATITGMAAQIRTDGVRTQAGPLPQIGWTAAISQATSGGLEK